MTTRLIGYIRAAEMLDIKIGTLRAMVCRGKIPHVRLSPRIVRFDVEELEIWINERKR